MTIPSAGWYPDPDNASTHRWWNGIAWTDNLTPAPGAAPRAEQSTPAVEATPAGPGGYVAYASPVSTVTESSYSTAYRAHPQTGYPGGYQISPPVNLTAPAGTAWSTSWIWLIVALPVATWLANQLVTVIYLFAYSIDIPNDAAFSFLTRVGPLAVGLILYALGVWFAYLDFRTLQRRGVPQPFHWAWGFANFWAVYVIGRSIVVKKRTGKGLAPLWVTVSFVAASFLFIVGLLIWAILAVV